MNAAIKDISEPMLSLDDLQVISETWQHLEGFLTGLMQGQVNIALLDHDSIDALADFIDHFSDDEATTVRNLPLHEVLQRLDQTLERVTEYLPYLSNEVFPVMTELGSKWAQVAQSLMVQEQPPKTAAYKARMAKESQQAKIRQLSVTEREAGVSAEEVLRRSSIRTQCLNAGLSNSFAKKLIRQNVPIDQIPERIAEALAKHQQPK